MTEKKKTAIGQNKTVSFGGTDTEGGFVMAEDLGEFEIDRLISSRQTPAVRNALKNAKIGIAGLGGLGSNIASMLVRSGIGSMVIADFDAVDASNLNRQNYYMSQIGQMKTDATDDLIKAVNPFIDVEKCCVKLDPSNIPQIFRDCEIVCEALDMGSEKAMLINTLLVSCPDVKIVSGSGMAGYRDPNLIRTDKVLERLYMCGDGVDMNEDVAGLMAPRVNICAGHMANTVIRLLMREEI